jgi:lipoprotein-releasing system permease protein
MFKPLSFYIGLRYVRAKRRNHFISFISMISMLGIALGVAVLITVISVMNGFDKELKDRILGMMPHVLVLGFEDEMPDWQDAQAILQSEPSVADVTPFVETQGLLSTPGVTRFVAVTGIDPEFENRKSFLARNMLQGSIDDLSQGSFNIVLGDQLANNLGVMLGDKVTLVLPEAALTPAGLIPRFKRFTVSGIFNVDYDYDAAFAYINMQDAQKILRFKDGVTGLNVKLVDFYQAPRLAKSFYDLLLGQYRIYDWTYLNGTFFEAVKLEKTMMYIILTLIIAVAAFNILSMLVMVVTDKQADIAILRTMGAKPRTITRIFMVQGSVIGVVGTILGVGLGIALALNVTQIVSFIEVAMNTQLISSEVYYISYLPAELKWQDISVIAGISLFLSFFATLYPAWRASKTQPAEALRYE